MMNTPFPPRRSAALARLAQLDPQAYAHSRNALEGAVSRLSPYVSHGLLALPELLQAAAARQPGLKPQHSWVYELGWREYFQDSWHWRGEAILQDLHPGPLPGSAYLKELPEDVRQGRTGLAVIDRAVAQLYDEGWLHNHARLWLASYLVHGRKLHWRVGADWLYGHLLDGDLASNHLSWQWVAGTGSRQPYLFNAENVRRHAPAPWRVDGSALDCPYEALEALARSPGRRLPPAPASGPGLTEPALHGAPPPELAPLTKAVDWRGREVWLVHPWSLAPPPADLGPEVLRVGVYLREFHQTWPWSARRWQFVNAAMSAGSGEGAGAQQRCLLDAAGLARAIGGARRVWMQAAPHWVPWQAAWSLAPALRLRPVPRVFAQPEEPCESFSQWWRRCGAARAPDLDALPGFLSAGAAVPVT